MTRQGLLDALGSRAFTFKDELLLFTRSHKEIEGLRSLIQAYKRKLADYYELGRDEPGKQQIILTNLRELQTLLDEWRAR